MKLQEEGKEEKDEHEEEEEEGRLSRIIERKDGGT